MIIDEEFKEKVLNKDLERQISNAIDPRFLLQLVMLSSHVGHFSDIFLLCNMLSKSLPIFRVCGACLTDKHFVRGISTSQWFI